MEKARLSQQYIDEQAKAFGEWVEHFESVKSSLPPDHDGHGSVAFQIGYNSEQRDYWKNRKATP